ncbi:MAG: hypothetical protein HQ547_06815 [Candidatus Omnitrophica bacterium]|nr:hypothetical protein [Candidatus Omnitrophota bacterium]
MNFNENVFRELNLLLDDSETDKMSYLSILKDLNNCKIGHHKRDNIGMNFLCGYYPVNHFELTDILEKARLLRGVFHKINLLYIDAISKADNYFLDIFESGILKQNRKIRNIHREIVTKKVDRLPLTFRADSPDLKHFVEFHSGIRGWGYLYAFRKVMDKYYGATSVFSSERIKKYCDILINELRGKKNFIVGFNGTYNGIPEMEYLFNNCFRGGVININPYILHFFFNTNYKRFGLNYRDMLNLKLLFINPQRIYHGLFRKMAFSWNSCIHKIIFNGCHEILKLYKEGLIDIEPTQNLLYDNKSIMALVWDDRYRGVFNDEERSIFPRTHFVRSGMRMQFSDGSYEIEDIIRMSPKNRRFILKYAGLNLAINFGGRTVFRLKTLSKKSTEKVLRKAVYLCENRGQPWIIQEDVSCKSDVKYFDIEQKKIHEDTLYKLYRPFFIYNSSTDNVEIVDIMMFFRNNFKVHAVDNGIFGLVDLCDTIKY